MAPFSPQPQVPERAGVLTQVIEENDCRDCGGTLVHSQYKGNSAAVCKDCGTPRVQVTES